MQLLGPPCKRWKALGRENLAGGIKFGAEPREYWIYSWRHSWVIVASMLNYQVRPARSEDAAAIAQLVASAADLQQMSPQESYPLDADVVSYWIRERDGGHVLLEDDEVLAYGELNPDSERRGRLWIGHLAVHPRRRRQGIGQRLVASLVRVADDRGGASDIWISAFEDNPAALCCYERVGFVRVGTRLVLGRILVDLRFRLDGKLRVLSAPMVAGLGLVAGLLSMVVLPGELLSALLEDWKGHILWLVLGAAVLCSAAALVARPLLPRRAESGLSLVLRPAMFGALSGILCAVGWYFAYGLAGGSHSITDMSLVDAARLGLEYGLGWGVITLLGVQFIGRRI